MIILFLISFSSFCYQALAAKMVYLYVLDDTAAFALVSSIFFIGMSRGCYRFLRVFKNSSSERQRYYLASNEVSVVLAALIMGSFFCGVPLLLKYFELHFPQVQLETLQIFVAVLAMIILNRLGTYLGLEICLSYNYQQELHASREKVESKDVGFAIAWTYLGGLIASALCAFWFYAQVNPMKFVLVPVFFNFVLAIYFVAKFFRQFSVWKKLRLILKLLFAVFIMLRFETRGEQLYQNSKFFLYNVNGVMPYSTVLDNLNFLKRRMQITSVASPYQIADWVTYLDRPKFSRLYLDGAFQFDTIDENKYHEPFWKGGLYFSGRTPQHILIMGGGDGLLAKMIFESEATSEATKGKITDKFTAQVIPEITLVELDSMVPQLANDYWKSSENNSLNKVKLELVDAFDYLRARKNQWSAIFLDFPDPRSAELSKLYSVEFYRMVKKNLSSDGFIVLDYPRKDSSKIISSTLMAAGFKNIIFYGKGNTFVYADAIDRSEMSLASLKASSPFFINSTPAFDIEAVNSIFNLRLP